MTVLAIVLGCTVLYLAGGLATLARLGGEDGKDAATAVVIFPFVLYVRKRRNR